jgi:predicted permease
MSWLDAIVHRARVLVGRERYANEQADELRFHLALAAQQHGDMPSARRRLGNLTSTSEDLRRSAGFGFGDRVRQDLTYALRGLRRSPAFTLTVVLTLALGVGANAAIYSFVDRVYLQVPTGVSEPSQVRRFYFQLRQGWPGKSLGAAFASSSVTYPGFDGMRAAVAGMADLAASSGAESIAVVTREHRIPARTDWVSQNYLAVLGVRPALGRFFAPDEGRIDVPSRVVVLSHALWRRTFGADSGVIGQTVQIRREPYTIIGVAQRGFAGIDLSATDMFAPLSTYDGTGYGGKPWYQAGNEQIYVVGRLHQSADERAVASRATPAFRRSNEAWLLETGRPTVDTVNSVVTGPIIAAQGPTDRSQSATMAIRLLGIASIVLLIACANIATLFLVRASRRRREIGVRLALGVTRSRLGAQLFAESGAVALLGAIAAILVANWGGVALRRMLLPSAVWTGPALNVRVALIATGVAMLVGMVAGLAPVLHTLRADFASALRAGSREGAYRRSRMRSALLITQGALSILLLVGAGLFVRSLGNVTSLPVGYDADHLMLATLPSMDGDPLRDERAKALEAVAARLRAVPGVRAVALSRDTPMRSAQQWGVYRPGRSERLSLGRLAPSVNNVSPEFFEATGIRVIDGRLFGANEHSVAMIDETMARTFWPGERAVGQCILSGSPTAQCTTIVGVVGNTSRFRRIEERPLQWYVGLAMPRTVLVRVDAALQRVIADSLRTELQRALPNGDEANIRMMTTDLERELRPWRLYASLFTALGLLALLVAGIGVYSVVAYSVSQRTHEMGIRMALGARASDVLNLIVGEGVRVISIGIAIGVVLSLVLARLVAALLFGVTPRDPFVLLGAACTLLAAGGVASAIPAWRAARVDPMTALRQD